MYKSITISCLVNYLCKYKSSPLNISMVWRFLSTPRGDLAAWRAASSYLVASKSSTNLSESERANIHRGCRDCTRTSKVAAAPVQVFFQHFGLVDSNWLIILKQLSVEAADIIFSHCWTHEGEERNKNMSTQKIMDKIFCTQSSILCSKYICWRCISVCHQNRPSFLKFKDLTENTLLAIPSPGCFNQI